MNWSDITSKNISPEQIAFNEIKQMSIECINYLKSLNNHSTTYINPRIMNNDIRYTGSDFVQIDGPYIDPYRKRKIPQKKHKNYSVKPKLPYQKQNKVSQSIYIK